MPSVTINGLEPSAWGLKELEELVAQAQPEDWHIEYKSSEFVNVDPPGARNRFIEGITKEVSAFANADGGIVVIGMREEAGARPIAGEVDDGVPVDTATPEWLAQVIQDNIDPALPALAVRGIELRVPGRQAFVVSVPRSVRAVQAKDLRYYQRHDSRSLPMRGFQIRDVNNRAEGPELDLEVRVPRGRIAAYNLRGTGLSRYS